MIQPSSSANLSGAKNLYKTILRIGFIVGSLDILAAFASAYLSSGSMPIRVLQFIASGIWGRPAFSGGVGMAAWGLLFHFIIAFSWTILFFLLYPTIKKISTNRVINGIAYGIIVWLVMNLVVVPLTNTPKGAFDPTRAIIATLILIICIGLPISFMVQRYYTDK